MRKWWLEKLLTHSHKQTKCLRQNEGMNQDHFSRRSFDGKAAVLIHIDIFNSDSLDVAFGFDCKRDRIVGFHRKCDRFYGILTQWFVHGVGWNIIKLRMGWPRMHVCQYQITIGRHRNQGAGAESTELNLATVNHSAWWNIMWELSVAAAAAAILFILTEVNDVLHDFDSLFCHWQHISFTLAQLLAKTKNKIIIMKTTE